MTMSPMGLSQVRLRFGRNEQLRCNCNWSRGRQGGVLGCRCFPHIIPINSLYPARLSHCHYFTAGLMPGVILESMVTDLQG